MTKPCLKLSSSSAHLDIPAAASTKTPLRTASPCLATKSVHFGNVTPDCVHEADEWDRTPTIPSKKLSYAEVLELKEIQLSLPRAMQPRDPFTGKYLGGHGICGTKIPVSLVPLLPEEPEKKPHPFSPPTRSPSRSPTESPRSSPTHSPRLSPSRTVSPFLPSVPLQPKPQKPAATAPAHLSFLSQLMPMGSPSPPARSSPPQDALAATSHLTRSISPPRPASHSTTARPRPASPSLKVVFEDAESGSSSSSAAGNSLPTPPMTPTTTSPPPLEVEEGEVGKAPATAHDPTTQHPEASNTTGQLSSLLPAAPMLPPPPPAPSQSYIEEQNSHQAPIPKPKLTFIPLA